jgi:hypothetical protein
MCHIGIIIITAGCNVEYCREQTKKLSRIPQQKEQARKKKRSYVSSKISIKDDGSNTVSHKKQEEKTATVGFFTTCLQYCPSFYFLFICMCKLCYADINVKRKEKGEGEEKVMGEYSDSIKKKTKSS